MGCLSNKFTSSSTSARNPFQTPSSSGILRLALTKIGRRLASVDREELIPAEADFMPALAGESVGRGTDRFRLGGRGGRRGDVSESEVDPTTELPALLTGERCREEE